MTLSLCFALSFPNLRCYTIFGKCYIIYGYEPITIKNIILVKSIHNSFFSAEDQSLSIDNSFFSFLNSPCIPPPGDRLFIYHNPLSLIMTENLQVLPMSELSNVLTNATKQFVAALRTDRPIEELEHLRDYLMAIRAEIRRREIPMAGR